MSPPTSDLRPIISLSTVAAGERAAAAAIAAQIPADGFTVLFCTTHYDLGRLGRTLQSFGRTRVVAATTSRAIGREGFLSNGITGFHLPGGRFKVADALIESTANPTRAAWCVHCALACSAAATPPCRISLGCYSLTPHRAARSD